MKKGHDRADVVKLAYALGSGPSSFIGVWVRLPPSAPFFLRFIQNRCEKKFLTDFFDSCLKFRLIKLLFETCSFWMLSRVWHNGCAPAFQAGYRGSTPLTRSI